MGLSSKDIETLTAMTEEERREFYIDWLLKRAAAAAAEKKLEQLGAQLLLGRLEAFWELDQTTIETWESEAALRIMRFSQGVEETNGRGS